MLAIAAAPLKHTLIAAMASKLLLSPVSIRVFLFAYIYICPSLHSQSLALYLSVCEYDWPSVPLILVSLLFLDTSVWIIFYVLLSHISAFGLFSLLS